MPNIKGAYKHSCYINFYILKKEREREKRERKKKKAQRKFGFDLVINDQYLKKLFFFSQNKQSYINLYKKETALP